MKRAGWSLESRQLRTKDCFGAPVKDRLVALAIAMSYKWRGFHIQSFPRYLRAHLPSADFAFTVEDQGDKHAVRRRGLAINRRTKELLVANRLVRADDCEPVWVLDRPYKGAEILDRKYGKPEPLLSPAQRTQFRAQEKEALAHFLANPKPVRTASLPRALALLRARKRSAAKDFARPAPARSLGRRLPQAWQQVLRIANGAKIRDCEIADGCSCTILALDQMAGQQRQEMKYCRDIGAEVSDRWQLVMQTELGDSVWLDTAKARAGDCRAVLLSHETGMEERDWSSVALFLEELLTASEE